MTGSQKNLDSNLSSFGNRPLDLEAAAGSAIYRQNCSWYATREEYNTLNRHQGEGQIFAAMAATKAPGGFSLKEPQSRASPLSPTSSGSTSSTTLTKSTRSYHVVGAIHPLTKAKLTLAEALECGVLNREQGTYNNMVNGEQVKLADAIQRGFVVTQPANGGEDTPASAAGEPGAGGELVTFREATYSVVGALHPSTREQLTVSRAVELGILDVGTGVYRDADGTEMNIAKAIDKGLVLVERGATPRRDRVPKKVASIHIEEEEQETLTVVEETLTETKKWIITSVVDPRTKVRVSFDEAVLHNILDQASGVYRNPDTGEVTPIARAIEMGLIEGELVSVNLNGDEFQSYSATGKSSTAVESVLDIRANRWLTIDEAVREGLVDQSREHYVDPATRNLTPLHVAVEKGLARKKAAVGAAEQQAKSGAAPGSETTSSVTARTVSSVNGQPAAGAEDAHSRARSVLDRTRLYTEQSSISQTERKLTGFTTDWVKERVYDLSCGAEMTFDEAIAKGIIDPNKVAVMRKFKEHQDKTVASASLAGLNGKVTNGSSSRSGSVIDEMTTTSTSVVSTTAPLVLLPAQASGPAPGPGVHQTVAVASSAPPAHGGSTSVSEYRKIAISKTISGGAASDRVSMALHLPPGGGCIEPRLGPLPYEAAVKMGLFNVKAGRYRDPVSEALMSFQDATAWGHLHPNGTAFTNLNTGQPLTLDDAVRQSLIDPDSGRPLEGRLRQLGIAVPDAFAVSRFVSTPPLNVEDAVKVGLLNPFTAVLTHPQSADETRSLGEAVHMRLIDGKSAVLWHPGGSDSRRYYIQEALRQRMLDPDTGDIVDPKTGAKIMSFYDAIKSRHIESVYDPVSLTVVDPNTGIRIDVSQAVKRGLLGPDTCLVYDTDQGRQLPFEEALARDIVDRQAGVYKDRKGARSLVMPTAFEMGLVEPIGAPLLHRMRMTDALSRLYPAATMATVATNSVLSPSSSHASVRLQVTSPASHQPSIPSTSVDCSQDSLSRTLLFSQDLSPSVKEVKATSPASMARERMSPIKKTLTPVQEEPVSITDLPHRVEMPPLASVLEPERSSQQPSARSAVDSPSAKKSNVHWSRQPSADGISDTEYFVKGGDAANSDLFTDDMDDHPIDHFVPSIKTPCPKSVQWDIALVKPAPVVSSVHRTVSEEESVRNVVKKASKMQVQIEAKAKPMPPSNEPAAEVQPALAATMPSRSSLPAPWSANDTLPANKDGAQPPLASAWPPVASSVQPQPAGSAAAPQGRIKDKEIIIIERQSPSLVRNVHIEQVTIDDAVERGLVTCPVAGGMWQYTDPTTGERMPLAEAVRRGYVRGSVDEARRALEISARRNNSDRDILEYKTVQEFSSAIEKKPATAGLPFADAIDLGQLDARTGTFRTATPGGGTCTLKEAVERGHVDGSSAEFVNPGNKRVYSLRDALEQRVLDEDGRWTSPTTGTKRNLDEAIKKGYIAVTMSEQTVNRVTTVTEAKKVAVDHVVHPVTMQPVGLQAALSEGIVQPSKCLYRNPATGDSLPLDEALKCGLIKGEVVDSKRTTEERIVDNTSIVSRRNEAPDSQSFTSVVKVVQAPTKTFAILSVTDPNTNRPITASEAMDRKIIDLGQALYNNTVTGEVVTFEEAIRKKLIRCVETTDLPIEDRFNITGVVDPRTGLQLSLADAISDGIIDFEKGLYINVVTGNSVPIETAVRRHLIIADGKVPENLTQQAPSTDEEVVDSVFVQTRSYTITHAIDPRTQEKIAINEALRRGLLDENLAVFHDLQDDVDLSVQDAIDKGLLIVSENEPSKTKSAAEESKSIQKSNVYSVEKVVDPKTKEEISPKEAVARGVIDEATGDYVNVDTMENWSLERAIKEGVVKARPPVAATSLPAHETVSFSIEAVVDPKTGEHMSASEALRHGFLGRGRQTFINPHTGETLSIQDAVHKGWIKLKTNYEKGRTAPRSRVTARPQGAQQAMAIRSVIDAKTGEELPVSQAVRHGILDRNGRSYHNAVTGETIPVDVAVQRGLIKIAASLDVESQAADSRADLTVHEATRQGLVNSRTGRYVHPSTGQVMPVEEAVRRGYLLREEGVSREEAAPQTGAVRGPYAQEAGGAAGSLGRQVANASGLPPTGTWRVPYTLQRRSPSPNRGAPNRPPTAEPAPASSSKVADFSSLPPSSIDVLSASHQGMIDAKSGMFVHPSTKQRMTLDDALIQGLVSTQAPVVPTLFRARGPNPLSVAEAFQRGLVNPLSLDVLNTHTGQWMTFDDALSSGYMQPRLQAGAVKVGGAASKARPAFDREPSPVAVTAAPPKPRSDLAARQQQPAPLPTGDVGQAVTSHQSWETHEVTTWQQTPGTGPPALGAVLPPPPPMRLAIDETPRLPPTAAQAGGAATLSRVQAGGQSGQSTFQRVTSQQGASFQQQAPPSPLMPGRHRVISDAQQQQAAAATRRANSLPRTAPPVSQVRADLLRRTSGTVLSPLVNSTAHFVNGKLYAVRPGYFIDASGTVIHSASGAHTTISQALSGDIIQLLPDEDEEGAAGPTFGRHGVAGGAFVDKASIPWDRGFTLERFMGEPVLPPALPLLPLAPPPIAVPLQPPPFGSLGRQPLPDVAAQFYYNDVHKAFSERTPANTFV